MMTFDLVASVYDILVARLPSNRSCRRTSMANRRMWVVFWLESLQLIYDLINKTNIS